MRRRLLGRAPRTRSVVAAAGLLVICGAPFAGAATGDDLREGVRNGTTSSETAIVLNINSTTATKGGYSTRQSNLSATGGGAIYGCHKTGGSAAKPTPQNPCVPATQNPCVRANNLSTGYAFEFHASNGPIVGLITAGAGGDTKKPFVTNATGVATGLNAHRLDNSTRRRSSPLRGRRRIWTRTPSTVRTRRSCRRCSRRSPPKGPPARRVAWPAPVG